MPVTLAIAIAAAVKAGCLLIGKEFMKRFGDVSHEDAAGASCLLIKDRLGQETTKESPSDALILYASREVVLSTSSRALAILTTSLALGSQFDELESNLFCVMNSFKFFAAWYRATCVDLVQSAFRSVISDMKMRIASFFGSVSESAVQKKAVASISFLTQVNFSMLMHQVILISKGAASLLKSRTEKNMSTLLGQIFPSGIGGESRCFDVLTDSTSHIGSCMEKYLAMVTTFVKQALVIFSDTSKSFVGALLQLQSTKVMTLVSLICIGVSFIGWNIPLMAFDGSELKQCSLQQPIISEAVTDLEVGSFSSITFRLMSLPVDTSNSLNLLGSFDSFEDIRSAMMNTRAVDRQGDLNHIGLVEYTPSLHLHSPTNNNFSAGTPELQTGCLWNDEAAAVSLVNWYEDVPHYIQSRSKFGSTLESSLLINVLAFDYSSNGIATKNFDGYCVSATTDEAFVSRYISQDPQNQSSVKLELYPPSSSSAADGDTSTNLMMISIAKSPLQELPKISYLPREFDGYSDSMQVDDQYSSTSTTVQVHEALTDLDHPGSIAYLLLYVWSDNDVLDASLPCRQTTSYFWDHEAAPALPLDGNIGAIHCIQSESSLFVHAQGGLLSDGYTYATNQFSLALDSLVLGLGHSLPRNTSGGDASSAQMIVTGLGPSPELSTICQEFEGSSVQNMMHVYPQFRLSSQSDFGKMKVSTPMNRSKRFSVASQSSLRFSAPNEYSIFCAIRHFALMLLMLAYHSSDMADDEPDGVALSSALSSGSSVSSGTNLDSDLEEISDNEVISSDGDNGEDTDLPLNTNIESSRRELKALRSELGTHWKSPSKRRRRMRRRPRTRSRPNYFEPTWASV